MKIKKAAKGQTTLQVDGLRLETVPDLLLEHGFALSNIRRISYLSLRLTVPALSARRARRLIAAAGYDVSIVRSTGFPHRAMQWRRRVLAALGLALALTLVLQCASRYWTVDISGCSQIPESALMAALNEYGYRPGMPMAHADLNAWCRRLQIDFPQAQWIGLSAHGVALQLEVVEKNIPPALTNPTGDIVAMMDGTVQTLTVLRGTAAVKIGDEVKAGDVLIRGVLQWKEGDAIFEAPTYAQGAVVATIYREVYVEAPTTVDTAQATGESRTAEFITFGSYRRKLRGSDPYDTQIETRAWHPIGGAYTLFPMGILEVTYHEQRFVPETVDRAALEEALGARAEAQLLQKLPNDAQVTDKQSACAELPELGVLGLLLWAKAELNIGGRAG